MSIRWFEQRLARRIALLASALAAALSGVAVGICLLVRPDVVSPASTALIVAGAIVLVAVGVALGVAYAVRRTLDAPLHALIRALEVASTGDFLIRVAAPQSEELRALAGGVNRLLATITDLQVNAIDSDRALASAQRELALTNEVAEKARIIQEQARLTEDRVRELELMLAATEAVSSRLDPGGVLRVLVDLAGRTLGFEECALLIRDEASGRFVVRATYGFSDGAAIEGIAFEPGEGITGQVATTGQMVLIDDTSRDQRYLHYKGRHLVDGAFVCLPIVDPRPAPSGETGVRLLGLFNVLRPRSAGFDDSSLRLLTALARQAALALANAALVARLERLSVTDELTGLANRRLFQSQAEAEVEKAVMSGRPLSLLMIDLDHFKRVNDDLGHLEGDAVLRRVAAALAAEGRSGELLARWGGEEFVVMLPGTGKREAIDRAERMRTAVVVDAHLTVSVGVASCPEDGRDTVSLVAASDRAMFEAKRAGRDQVMAAPAGSAMATA